MRIKRDLSIWWKYRRNFKINRIGPPDIESLELPKKYEVALNNQLFDRNLFTWSDVRHRPEEIRAALKAVFRADELAIMNLYKEVSK